MYLICSIRTVLGYVVYSSKRCKMAHKTQAQDVFSHNKKNTYSLSHNTKGTHLWLDFQISLTLSKKKEELTLVICYLFSIFLSLTSCNGRHSLIRLSKCLVFCRPVPNSSSPLLLITNILISRVLGRITYSFMFLPLVIKSIGHDFVVFKCIDFRKVDDFDLFN